MLLLDVGPIPWLINTCIPLAAMPGLVIFDRHGVS
jgi:hypothetical protein